MTVLIKKTEFIQKVIKLDGSSWRLTGRPYIFSILNSTAKRNLMLAARQVEKSTNLSGLAISTACLNPNFNILYVSPTMKQTGVFSRKKIDEAFEVSKLLRTNFYPGVKGFRMEEKRLKNYTTMYFRSAYHDADSIRGITADIQLRDEMQDMLSEIIPVIDACSQKRKHAQFFNAGTPKTFDNTIEQEWRRTTQNEWHIKCMSCGYWNLLDIDCIQLDNPGLWCKRCKSNRIYTKFGCWVSGNTNSEYQGSRLPYIILPEDDIDWKDLYYKMKNWGTAELMNEVFGVSYDNGKKPITIEELKAVCDPDRKLWEYLPANLQSTQMYAGIDWGGGNTGFSILTIGYPTGVNDEFHVVYVKRFIGREADPEVMLPIMAKKIQDFNAHKVGADQGFGFGLNERLRKMIPSHYVYATYMHSYIRKMVAYDEDAQRFVTNRTEVMTELFNRIKRAKVKFFNWNEFETFGEDYLNINSEYSDRLRQLRYIHTRPDDSFHSGLYALLTWMISTNQTSSTRYVPSEDNSEGIMHLSD